MRTSTLIAILGLAVIGFASSLKFDQGDLDTLNNAVELIRKDIQKERTADELLIQERTRVRDTTKADYEAAEVRVTEALKVEAAAKADKILKQTQLEATQAQYALGKKTRDEETVALDGINAKVGELTAIGGETGGTIGKLPPAPEAPVSTPVPQLLSLLQESRARELRQMLLDISRGFVESATMKQKIGTMKAAIKVEEEKDDARVQAATKARDLAVEVYNKAVAAREAEEAYRDKAKALYEAAQKALEHDQAEVDKAEAARKSEEDTLTQFLEKVKELVDVRVKAEAEYKANNGGMTLLEIQTRRANAATEALKTTLKAMEDKVREEEAAQRQMMQEAKEEMLVALAAMEEAITNYKLAVKFFETKTQEYTIAYGEWKAAERDLADERAVANQEREMIQELRDTIATLSGIKESTGNCKVVDGMMCSGAGTCGDLDTCKCNFGHAGVNCERCSFNFHKENGVCVPDTSMMSLLQYGAADIGQILLSVNRDSTASQISGVEGLLKQMEDKLNEAERKLVAARDAKRVIRDTKKAEMDAAEQDMIAKKKIQDQKIEEYEFAKEYYETIVALFNREQPIREGEYAKFKELNDILAQLEGIDVYQKQANPFGI